MDGSMAEHTFGGYQNGTELSFTNEEKQQNILADYSPSRPGTQTAQFGRESSFSPNFMLDLRLENDRVKSELSAVKEAWETEVTVNDKKDLTTCLLAIEIDRLNEVIGQMASKIQMLQNYLEEATKTVGDTGRTKELELQLDNLLSINQRNLEALKYKKLSLDKARKRIEQLQAENILLKMALEAAILSSNHRDDSKDGLLSDRRQSEYEKLQERYSLLEKQNYEQENFARSLDAQVSQLTKYIQDTRERSQTIDKITEENGLLKIALTNSQKRISQLEDLNHKLSQNSNFEIGNEQETEVAPSLRNRRTFCPFSLVEDLALEINKCLAGVPKESSGFYDCEMIRLKIQAFSRSLADIAAIHSQQAVSSKHSPETDGKSNSGCYDSIRADTVSLGQTIGKVIESLISSQTTYLQMRTRSERKQINKSMEHESSFTLDDLKRENQLLKDRLKQVELHKEEKLFHKNVTEESLIEHERNDNSRKSDQGEHCSTVAMTTGLHTQRSSSTGNQQSIITRLSDQLALSNSHCEQISAMNEELRNRVTELEESKEALRRQLTSKQTMEHKTTDGELLDRLEQAESEVSRLVEETCLLRARLIDAEEELTEVQNQEAKNQLEIANLRLQLARREPASNENKTYPSVEETQFKMAMEDLQRMKSSLELEVCRLERQKSALLDELDMKNKETSKAIGQTKVFCSEETRKALAEQERQFSITLQNRELALQEEITDALERDLTENLLKSFKEKEARERSKLEQLSSKCRSLEEKLQNAEERAHTLEAELVKERENKKNQTKNRSELMSAGKISECGTVEIEDMRQFMKEMKQESNYASEGREVRELKELNRQLMDQLVRAEQNTIAQITHTTCDEEKNKLLKEISVLKQEMIEIEKTCKLMKDKLSTADQNKSKAFDEASQQLIKLRYEKESLTQSLKQSLPSIAVTQWLSRLFSNFSLIKQELVQVKSAHQELSRMFMTRVHSLRVLFNTEAELAPRGTLSQIVKLREYNSSGANKLQSTLERVCDQLSTTRLEVGQLKAELQKSKTETSNAKADARRLRIEFDKMENKTSQLIDELESVKEQLAKERDAKDRERRQKDIIELEKVRREDHWQEERAREREAQNILKDIVAEREEENEILRGEKERLAEEVQVLIRKLEDNDSRKKEAERNASLMSAELKQNKLLLKDYISNKENVRYHENSLATKVKDLEHTVEVLTEKLERKNKEMVSYKNSDSKMPAKESTIKSTDRVSVIRTKIEQLFDKMTRTVKNISEAEAMIYNQSGGNKDHSPLSNKAQSTPLAISFHDDLQSLLHEYESLGKKYVNEAIDICQKSLKIFEGMQSAHHRLCPKLAISKIH